MSRVRFAAPEPDRPHPALHAENLIRPLSMLVTLWKSQGHVASDVDPELAAMNFIAIHYPHILALLSELIGPVDEVIEHLRAALELAFRGISPRGG
jgi:hypothetical protein